jgi:hypothetical protein
MSKASDWSRAHLEALPTLRAGHTDNLKVETLTERVWLSRLTKADGFTGDPVTVEHLGPDGAWR